jgi:hypothetical protein
MLRARALLNAAGLVAALAAGCGRDTTLIGAAPEAHRAAGEATSELAHPAPAAAGSAAAGSAAVVPGGAGSANVGSAPVEHPGTSPLAQGAAAPSAAGGASGTAAAASGSAPPASEQFRHAAPGRLIAIGDLHGDVSATRAALRLGGAIDDSDRWIGKDLTVVQTGDELDRGDEERDILDLFERLKTAAAASGGQVITLNGNHEVMNVQGDFRYVTPGGITAFAGVRPRSPFAKSAPAPFEDRAAAFLPGGAYALELAKREVIAVVGDTVFVHGGVLPAHVRYGIDKLNSETRDWMSGNARGAPDIVASEDGPVWVRAYSLEPVAASACDMLGEVLAALHVRRMVVGHTVQKTGITSGCDDRVYRIDVGLSRYYGDGPIQVLEIRGKSAGGSEVRTLSAPRAATPQ